MSNSSQNSGLSAQTRKTKIIGARYATYTERTPSKAVQCGHCYNKKAHYHLAGARDMLCVARVHWDQRQPWKCRDGWSTSHSKRHTVTRNHTVVVYNCTLMSLATARLSDRELWHDTQSSSSLAESLQRHTVSAPDGSTRRVPLYAHRAWRVVASHSN